MKRNIVSTFEIKVDTRDRGILGRFLHVLYAPIEYILFGRIAI